ncbi:MAG TPA: hypothetical protein VEN47_02085 [Myxococcota bacterium]|nr:hypothetical protein [Myxococcota bacterium]
MRRGVVIAFAILGLSACGQKESGSSGPMDAPAAPPAPAAAKPEAAAPAAENPPPVSAPAQQDSSSCLDLVGAGSFAQAIPVCTAALQADPANEQLKSALETAKTKAAEMSGSAAGAAEGAAGDAAGEAADKAKQEIPAKPY